MTDPFEYDVFISFSSADEEIVKPIWQELCSNGLRVFWSDSTLKKEVGNSWFEVIEKSLERSKHMLLVCSNNSMGSKWVAREYRAFFEYCYSPNSRRLIPLLTRDFSPKSLPIFLRELQVGNVSDSNFIHEIIPILGGVNIEQLQQELKSLQQQVNSLSIDTDLLNKNIKVESDKVYALDKENKLLKAEAVQLRKENALLNKMVKEKEKSFLLSETNFQKLQQEYQSVQAQVNSLLSDSRFFEEKAKAESNNFNLLTKENNFLNNQLVELKNQNKTLSEAAEKEKNILIYENASLKEQVSELGNNIILLTEKISSDKTENTNKPEEKVAITSNNEKEGIKEESKKQKNILLNENKPRDRQANKPSNSNNALTEKTSVDKSGNTGKPEKKKSNEEVNTTSKSALKLKKLFGKTMYCSECGYDGLEKNTLICPRCKSSFKSSHLW